MTLKCLRLLNLVFLIVLLLLFFQGLGSARVGMPENLWGGNCSACHKSDSVLPEGHPDPKLLRSGECDKCHIANGIRTRGKLPLGHVHLLNGVDCDDCHENPKAAKPLLSDQCLLCHETRDDVAARTAGADPNPHDSPHYGKDLDCELCHHMHKKPDDFCVQCHNWDYRIP